MSRRWLGVEYALVFFGVATVYAVLLRGTSPIPFLLVLAAAVVWYLRRSAGFDRRNLWRAGALRGQARPMAALFAVSFLALVAAVALLYPDQLFDLPRERPDIWLLIAIFYPLLSVYPQELIFRAFLFQRYEPLFGRRWIVAASAAAFGYVHIAFGSWISVALTVVGGWIFARRYQRTQSLLAASVEHALYGIAVFTVGLGEYFYHGSATVAT